MEFFNKIKDIILRHNENIWNLNGGIGFSLLVIFGLAGMIGGASALIALGAPVTGPLLVLTIIGCTICTCISSYFGLSIGAIVKSCFESRAEEQESLKKVNFRTDKEDSYKQIPESLATQKLEAKRQLNSQATTVSAITKETSKPSFFESVLNSFQTFWGGTANSDRSIPLDEILETEKGRSPGKK